MNKQEFKIRDDANFKALQAIDAARFCPCHGLTSHVYTYNDQAQFMDAALYSLCADQASLN